ncbi:olfactory receptor 6B1-like [Hyla sarda]|uniref:olfactory receptor 6B1-like n=1 Tax=Hyla sarda TaxID=327740 RepID=UPI0024C31D68|nr:olfactory receptor 6B1-like [Hyla sarda]
MKFINQSEAGMFILLGFPSSRQMQVFFFGIFLAFYLLTISANMFIVGIVAMDRILKKIPMYIFLSHFSFLEIWYITSMVPKMLVDFLADNNTISYNGCIAQVFFFCALAFTELFFLSAIAYDRYLAICHPLRYTTMMTIKLCQQMALWSWIVGFVCSLLMVIPSSRLLFCAPRSINHFFCDFIPLLNISCSQTPATDVIFYTLAWIIILYSLLLTSISYVQIMRTVYYLPSQLSRSKAFSTCLSHLTVVLTFYGAIIFMYIQSSTKSMLNVDKVASIFYAVVIPLFNPLVYTLRNRDFHAAMKKNLPCVIITFCI